MKKILITLCSIGLALQVASAQGTVNTTPARLGPPDVSILPYPLPDLPPIREEIIALRRQIHEVQKQLTESRIQMMRDLGRDATAEERQAALEQWYIDQAGNLAEARILNAQLDQLLRQNRPDPVRPLPIALPDEIAALQNELREAREALQASRADLRASLGEDATEEEIRAALEAWYADNKTAIDAVQAMAQELREWFRDQRPVRPEPPVPGRVAERRQEFRDNVEAIRENRREFGAQMTREDLTAEERKALIEAFREEQRDLMKQRMEMRRLERAPGGESGDRRPGG